MRLDLLAALASSSLPLCLSASFPVCLCFFCNLVNITVCHCKYPCLFECGAGGGWCYDEVDCLCRAATGLGTSTGLAPYEGCGCMNAEGDGLSSDCNCIHLPYSDGASFSGYGRAAGASVFPHLGAGAHVLKARARFAHSTSASTSTSTDTWYRYAVQACADNPLTCTHATHARFRAKPWPVPGMPGKVVHFKGIKNLDGVLDFAMANGLGKASEMVITGGSAGGLSTFLHADR